jgi:hypothetical protein
MKHTLLILVAICVAVAPSFAGAPGSVAGTLYQQEGTTADGPSAINAAGQNTSPDASYTNWKWQTGAGSWSGVYAGANGWIDEATSGDMSLDVEADIEMYVAQTIAYNKVYFHIGNPFTASAADKTAYVNGSMVCNNGQYIGISFLGTGKADADFEKVGGAYTGKILGGMVSDRDTWRTQTNSFDVRILLGYNGSTQVPVNYGDGAHNTVHDTLWWLVNGGAPGSYVYTWQIELLCDPLQPDGDYQLDPVVVAAPVL